MFEVYLHGDWSKVDSKIGINIKNAWSRESKSHGECELIVLSKTVYVEWDHLIHRKRSPFPYAGKALTPLNGSETYNAGRGTTRQRFARRILEDAPQYRARFLSFPSRGRGTAPRWMR